MVSKEPCARKLHVFAEMRLFDIWYPCSVGGSGNQFSRIFGGEKSPASDEWVAGSKPQSWALSVFLNFFSIKKIFFAFFIKLISYFFTIPIKKPTPSQINLIKNAKQKFFIIQKIQKYRKCPALKFSKAMSLSKITLLYSSQHFFNSTAFLHITNCCVYIFIRLKGHSIELLLNVQISYPFI